MTQAIQLLIIALCFLIALVLAPLALGLAAVWLVGRVVNYATTLSGRGELVGWSGIGSASDIENAQAFPCLAFVDRHGTARQFTSRKAFHIYDDPPPREGLPIRYRLYPWFFAEVDDKAHWFTGPVLAVAAAMLGTFIASVWRPIAAIWLGP